MIIDIKQMLANAIEGETLLIPSGVYNVVNATCNKSVNLIGVGNVSFVGDGDSRFCKFKGLGRTNIENITFSNYAKGSGAKGTIGLFPTGYADRVSINRCNFYGCAVPIYGARIKDTSINLLEIKNSYMVDSWGGFGAITVGTECEDAVIDGCYIDGANSSGISIYLDNSIPLTGNVSVSNTVVKNITGHNTAQAIVTRCRSAAFNNLSFEEVEPTGNPRHYSQYCSIYTKTFETLVNACRFKNAGGVILKLRLDETTRDAHAILTNNFFDTDIVSDDRDPIKKWATSGITGVSVGPSFTATGNRFLGMKMTFGSRGRCIVANNSFRRLPYRNGGNYAMYVKSPTEPRTYHDIRDNHIESEENPIYWVKG